MSIKILIDGWYKAVYNIVLSNRGEASSRHLLFLKSAKIPFITLYVYNTSISKLDNSPEHYPDLASPLLTDKTSSDTANQNLVIF